MAFGLPHEAVDLGMAFFAVDYHLRLCFVGFAMIGVADAALQLQHHGAGGIYYLYPVGSSHFVGFGRLAVSAQQHFHIVELSQLVVGDGLKPYFAQSLHLVAVMHYVAEAIQMPRLIYFFFCFLYGGHHAEAKSRTVVNLYYCHRP